MIKLYLTKLFEQIKEGLLIAASAITSAILIPIAELVLVAITLAIFDMLIAIIVSIKKNGFKSFSSSKMENTFLKLILYCGLIIVFQVIDVLFLKTEGLEIIKIIGTDTWIGDLLSKVRLPSAALFLIILRESRSIDEKWEDFFGWSFYDTVYGIISKIKKLKNKKNDTEQIEHQSV